MLNENRTGLSVMYRGSIAASLTKKAILRRSLSLENPNTFGTLNTEVETSDSEVRTCKNPLKELKLGGNPVQSLELQLMAAIREVVGTTSYHLIL
jgi:hypothetical protein